ncbi:MAG: chorismate mutase [Acidimicrobiia bacterium]|nr:chorismate mutase [Acidimicrobiia bacterium]
MIDRDLVRLLARRHLMVMRVGRIKAQREMPSTFPSGRWSCWTSSGRKRRGTVRIRSRSRNSSCSSWSRRERRSTGNAPDPGPWPEPCGTGARGVVADLGSEYGGGGVDDVVVIVGYE